MCVHARTVGREGVDIKRQREEMLHRSNKA